MKLVRLAFLTVFLLALTACGEEGVYRATLISEGEHVVETGERLEGLVVLAGGTVQLVPGSFATGPIYILDGTLSVGGEIERDVAILGGALDLRPGARVGGSLNVGGGEVSRSPDAAIAGTVVTSSEVQLPLSPGWTSERRGRQLIWSLINTVGLALLAAGAVRFSSRPLGRVAQAVAEQPVAMGAFGVLVGLVAPALLVLMAFTIILIPVAVLGGALLLLAIAYGLVGMGVLLGEQLGARVRWHLPAPARAFVGTALLMLFLNLGGLLPLLGGIVPLLTMAVALGATLLTRFGARHFVPAIDEMPAVPVDAGVVSA